MTDIHKQRNSRRFPVQNKIVIKLNSGEEITSNIINISNEGICILTDKNVPVGDDFQGLITIGTDTCEVIGTITWCAKIADNFKTGLQLRETTDQYHEFYERISKKFGLSKSNVTNTIDDFHIIHR